jgi:putative membrane protein
MMTILSLWTWYPSVIIGCAGLIIGYLVLVNFRLQRKFFLFLGGVLALFIALVSPLDALGDTYLFSAHMLQHQLLILAVPPLLMLGIPEEALRHAGKWVGEALRHSISRKRGDIMAKGSTWVCGPGGTAAAWLIGVGTIWIWHLPGLYDAALADERIHVLEHLAFLATSAIFWWPVLSPIPELRLGMLPKTAYLLLAAVACDILGTLIAYSPTALYPAYLHPEDVYGILSVLRGQWGITASVDQQAGGLLMGITGNPVYILIALSAMARWYRRRGSQV